MRELAPVVRGIRDAGSRNLCRKDRKWTHRMERFDLSVEQPVLLDARVAVHGPDQAE